MKTYKIIPVANYNTIEIIGWSKAVAYAKSITDTTNPWTRIRDTQTNKILRLYHWTSEQGGQLINCYYDVEGN